MTPGGDHSGARKHAREARILRNSALTAHAAAAEAIEHANNEGRGLDMWTLDLHGLHVTEAIVAVDRRWGESLTLFGVLGPMGSMYEKNHCLHTSSCFLAVISHYWAFEGHAP